MNPTQPKDAEMDEKKFPPIMYLDVVRVDKKFYGTDEDEWGYTKNVRAYKTNECTVPFISLEEHQHILSEERARLEGAVDVLKYALDSDEFYCECCEDAYGVVANKCARCAVMIFVAKLKSQPTEDKSGVEK